jgi:hypothetical protein
MTPSQVQQLIDAVKAASPLLWNSARQQVNADILSDIVMSVIMVVLLAWCIYVAQRSITAARQFEAAHIDSVNWNWGIASIFAVFAVVFAVLLLININDLIYKATSPDYATLQHIRDLIPSK